MNTRFFTTLIVACSLLLAASPAGAQRGGSRVGGFGGGQRGGGGFGGGSQHEGGGFGGGQRGAGGFGAGSQRDGGAFGGGQRGGGGFGGGLSSDRSFGGGERGGFDTGSFGHEGGFAARPGAGVGGAGRPGVGAGGAGGPINSVGTRPGAGLGGAGRPGLGAGGVGGPDSGIGVQPGAGAGRPGFGAGGVGGPDSGIGFRPGAGAGGMGFPGTHYASADARDAQCEAFRAGAVGYPHYNAAAFGRYPNAWQPANLVNPSLYTHPGYGPLATGLGLAAQPVVYDYGGNVVAQPTAVYVNGDVAGTPQQYAQQSSAIASAGQAAAPPAESKWLPLGVFAVVEGDATSSDDIFQLAVNRQGIIRGNYHNTRTNQVEKLSGSVDTKSQRTAWTIGGDKAPVYEVGIGSLTKDIAPMLVQMPDGQSRQVNLIRLPQPEQSAAGN